MLSWSAKRILVILALSIFSGRSAICEDDIFRDVPANVVTLSGLSRRAPNGVGLLPLTNNCDYTIRYAMKANHPSFSLGWWVSKNWIWPHSLSIIKVTCDIYDYMSPVNARVSLTAMTARGNYTKDVEVQCWNYGVMFQPDWTNPMNVSSTGEQLQYNISLYGTRAEFVGVELTNALVKTYPLVNFASYYADVTPVSTCRVTGGESLMLRRRREGLEEFKESQCDALQGHPYLSEKRHCRGPTTTTSTTTLSPRPGRTEPEETEPEETEPDETEPVPDTTLAETTYGGPCCEDLEVDIRDDPNYRKFSFPSEYAPVVLVTTEFVFPLYNENGTNMFLVDETGVLMAAGPRYYTKIEIPHPILDTFWAAYWQYYDAVAEVGGVGNSSQYTVQWTDASIAGRGSFTFQTTLFAEGNWKVRSNLCDDQGDLIENSLSGYQEEILDNFNSASMNSTFDAAPGYDVERRALLIFTDNPFTSLARTPATNSLAAAPGSLITLTTTGADELPLMNDQPIGELHTVNQDNVVMGAFPIYARLA